MPGRISSTLVAVSASVLVVAACKQSSAPPGQEPAQPSAPAATAAPGSPDRAQARQLFGTLPARFESATNPMTPAKLALGKQLYHDARLSKNQDVSCNSCHDVARFGVDGLPVSKGHKGQVGNRNSPTVFNAAGHASQFWDGRATDVEAQAKGPMLNPLEMAMKDEAAVVAIVESIPEYPPQFAAAFPGEARPLTLDNVARAIAAYERTLVTTSPFDAWLAGDDAALSPQSKQGLALFVGAGCTGCHAGPLLGGTMFMKLGLVRPYDNLRDTGRMEVTKAEVDRFAFKVPSLRNVARTAPYFHDGAIGDLPTAIAKMGELQLGKAFSADEVRSIAAFLEALTGQPPADVIAVPALPRSGKATPKPDPT